MVEFWFSGKRRIATVKAFVRAAPDFLKNEDTWCKMLNHWYSPKSIQWAVAQMIFYTFLSGRARVAAVLCGASPGMARTGAWSTAGSGAASSPAIGSSPPASIKNSPWTLRVLALARA